MTLTQILQKIKSAFYTKAETDTVLNAKANDSDVVHKSGDETISGTKTFNSIFLKSSKIERGSLPESNIIEDREISIVDKHNRGILGIFNYYYTNGSSRTSFYAYNLNTTDYDNLAISFEFENTTQQKSLIPVVDNAVNLGTSTNKWKTLNGINPGALSLPSNNHIDILSTLQSGGYTAPSNGYVRAIKNVRTECSSTFGIRNETTGVEDRRITERLFVIGVMVPVKTGEKVIISDDWNSISNVNITYSASFYPCSGNV